MPMPTLPTSSASSIENMFESLCIEQGMQEFQGRTDAKFDTMQRIAGSATEPMQERRHAMEGAHEMAVTGMRQQIADIKCAQLGVETHSTDAKKELALVEAQEPAPPAAQAGWDRAPGRTKVRTTRDAEFAFAQIEQAIRPLIEGADSNATRSCRKRLPELSCHPRGCGSSKESDPRRPGGLTTWWRNSGAQERGRTSGGHRADIRRPGQDYPHNARGDAYTREAKDMLTRPCSHFTLSIATGSRGYLPAGGEARHAPRRHEVAFQ